MSWIDRINIDIDGLAFVDETRTNVGSSAFKLDHDWFTEQDLEIRTAAGGGGILLVKGTDYDLLNEDTSLSARATAAYGATRNVWEQIQVTNVTYQTGTLYFSGDYIADTIDADDMNEAVTRCHHEFTLQEAAALGDLILARGSNFYVDHAVPAISVQGSGMPEGAGVTLLTNSLLIGMWEDAGQLYFQAATIAADLTLTFGATQNVAATISAGFVSVHRLSDTSFLAVWNDATTVRGVVGTVAGTVITLGASTQLSTGDARLNCGVAVESATKFTVVFADTAAANNIAAVVATISGTTITPGATVNNGSAGWGVSCCYVGTDEVLVGWRPDATTLRFERLTISGTVVTWDGNEYALETPTASTIYVHFMYQLGPDHAFCVFQMGVTDNYTFMYTVLSRLQSSGDFDGIQGAFYPLGYGRATTAADERTWWCEFDGKQAALYWMDDSRSRMALFVPSAESLVIGNTVQIGEDEGSAGFSGMCYAVAIREGIIGRSVLNSSNFAAFQALQVPVVLGIADNTGTTPKGIVAGYSANFTGLTPGVTYYLSPKGGLITGMPLPGAYVGKAISATEVVR